MSAIGLLDIQFLEPLRIYPPFTFFALVCIEEGSDPWSGSVKPKQPINISFS